jgi:hypothetical protein
MGDEGKAAGCVPLAALLFDVQPVEKFNFRALWIICCCKLSKGLVIAFSYCGLTSSGIGQFSCCTSPYGRTKKRASWPRRKLSGPLFLIKQRYGKL